MGNNLRPEAGAKKLGVSKAKFWLLAKEDPDFPELIKLSPRCTIVREDELDAYVDKKAVATRKAREQSPLPVKVSKKAVVGAGA